MDDGTISFENSKRIRERRLKVDELINQAALDYQQTKGTGPDLIGEITKQQRSHLNREVFNLAEQQGVTVYDICLRYMPQYAEPQIDLSGDHVNMTQEVRLVPMPLELEKGPGYWKGKYFRLKERMQELIDSKEDGSDGHQT